MQLGLDVVQPVLRLSRLAVALGDVEQVAHALAQRLEDDASDHVVAVVGREVAAELVEVRMQAPQLDVRGLRLADGLVHVAIDVRHGDCEIGIVHLQLLDVPQRQVDRAAGFQVIRLGAGVQEAYRVLLASQWIPGHNGHTGTHPSAAAWCSPGIPPSPGSRICPRWSSSWENSSCRRLWSLVN